jgi:hypothetical protein
MSWVQLDNGDWDHRCDRCNAHPTATEPFGEWTSVLFPGGENAKHFCGACLEALRVALDDAMARPDDQ